MPVKLTRTRIMILILAIAWLLTAASRPAAAQSKYQTTFQLRYWGTGADELLQYHPDWVVRHLIEFVQRFGGPGSLGGTLRLDSRTSRWSLSGRYDSISMMPITRPWTTGSVWDMNVHHRLGAGLDSYVGLFAGYGGISLGTVSPRSGSGFRFGGEFMSRWSSGWYLTGEVALGSSWSTSLSGMVEASPSNSVDYRLAVGREMSGGWGIEASLRRFFWRVPTEVLQLEGVTAGITYRR
jgi:hypothetical protein